MNLIWHGGSKDALYAPVNLRPLMRRNHAWLYPIDSTQPSVELLGITRWGSRGQVGTDDARAVEIGFAWKALDVDVNYNVVVQLQPGAILSRTRISTGPKREVFLKGGTIAVRTPFGRLTAQQTYQHSAAIEFGDIVSSEIVRSTIGGTIIVPAGVSLHDVHNQLRVHLDQICSLLAFCFRQPVRYYEVEYMKTSKGPGAAAAVYRVRWQESRTARSSHEELIHADQLVNRGLQRIVTAFVRNKHSDAILRAIDFIVSSYEVSEDVGYFMAFSALETIIDTVPRRSRTRVSMKKWSMVMNEVTAEMKRQGRRFRMDLSAEIKRLPNLRAASFSNRVSEACACLKPETKDLWPQEIGFSTGIARAARMRNELFHGAKADDFLYDELVRIRTFVERLITRSLRWPDDRLWNWRDQLLDRINHP